MPPPPPAFATAGSGSARHADANSQDPDLGVIQTNDEASGAKASCVSRGYFDDPFVKHFARRVPKHPPLINRGYHARVATVRAVLDAFLDATFDADRAEDDGFGKTRQIVSLGAGFDTSCFRLRDRLARSGANDCRLTFVEIDHPSVMRTKAAVVNATATLRAACVGGDGVRRRPVASTSSVVVDAFADGGGYALCGCDLRDPRALDAALDSVAGLDPNAPTLFLAECCLAYLEADEADAALRWAARWGRPRADGESLPSPGGGSGTETPFPAARDGTDARRSTPTRAARAPPLRAFFAYDPTLTGTPRDDAFGEQMLVNLKTRGCPLLGAEAVLGAPAHASRARRNGWPRAGAADMLAASARLATEDAAEARRVAFLEPLDEIEEYCLMQKHYVTSWGVLGDETALGGLESDATRLERVVDRGDGG